MYKIIKIISISSMLSISFCAHAALSLDRTRIIFNGDQKSVILNISNNSNSLPYLAQSWIENTEGKKVPTPFAILPPIQRVEVGKPTQIKIEALPIIKRDLPQDRESLYYFNFREIPPKSDQANVLQLSIQTKIKLFYRPKDIIVTGTDINNNPWQPKLTLSKNGTKITAKNPTAYYTTIIGITAAKNKKTLTDFNAFMVPPFGEKALNIDYSLMGTSPILTYIDDYGGRVKMSFACNTTNCTYIKDSLVK
ncbi:fimbria/pilus periplasmic chaperone [Moellerella wisconsensis]|uniref:fimbria/pilus periplasmic chaperone n=1 Tax=Moellerella wisconsensis TaxID=158849 RepID=UPI0025B0EAB1|nr:fimbria/pilus periplasmic chaperone [Moellerella wisconsensis]WJW83112.1 fimbria/pilus periplasmic chaperone [Moellerella wisconsensis]